MVFRWSWLDLAALDEEDGTECVWENPIWYGINAPLLCVSIDASLSFRKFAICLTTHRHLHYNEPYVLQCTICITMHHLHCNAPSALQCTICIVVHHLHCSTPSALQCTICIAMHHLHCSAPSALQCTIYLTMHNQSVLQCIVSITMHNIIYNLTFNAPNNITMHQLTYRCNAPDSLALYKMHILTYDASKSLALQCTTCHRHTMHHMP